MVGLGTAIGILSKVGSVVKKNPIKTFALVLFVGSALGVAYVGQGIVKDYNDTKDKIVQVQQQNTNLLAQIQNEIDVRNEILERLDDVEESRERLEQQIEDSQIRIAEYERRLQDIDLETNTEEDASLKVNQLWAQAVQCLESASRGESECEN